MLDRLPDTCYNGSRPVREGQHDMIDVLATINQSELPLPQILKNTERKLKEVDLDKSTVERRMNKAVRDNANAMLLNRLDREHRHLDKKIYLLSKLITLLEGEIKEPKLLEEELTMDREQTQDTSAGNYQAMKDSGFIKEEIYSAFTGIEVGNAIRYSELEGINKGSFIGVVTQAVESCITVSYVEGTRKITMKDITEGKVAITDRLTVEL